MPFHKQVTCGAVQCDEAIAPLVEVLNSIHGVTTKWSCQNCSEEAGIKHEDKATYLDAFVIFTYDAGLDDLARLLDRISRATIGMDCSLSMSWLDSGSRAEIYLPPKSIGEVSEAIRSMK